MKFKEVFSTVAVSLISMLALTAGAQECPKQIVLSGPSFINHQKFPTDDQIKTNLNQMIHDMQGDRAWSDDDLRDAGGFVSALEKHVQNNQILLQPQLHLDGAGTNSCIGSFEGMPFTVTTDSMNGSFQVQFEFESEAISNGSVFISSGSHSAVTFEVYLPSNCSGCSSTAELFEFQQVTAADK